MTESEALHINIEKLINFFGLSKSLIDDRLGWKNNKYSRIHNRLQEPTLTDLVEIAELYGVKVRDLLDKNMKIPPLNSLSNKIKQDAQQRIGKPVKEYERSNLSSHLILILSNHYEVNSTYTTSDIRSYLPLELQNKSIEWAKSILSPFIEDTGKTRPGKTKPEKVYRLIQAIPRKMVGKAKEIVDDEWLQEILKK